MPRFVIWYDCNLFASLAEVSEINTELDSWVHEVKKTEDLLEAQAIRFTSTAKHYLIDFIDEYVENYNSPRNSGSRLNYIFV